MRYLYVCSQGQEQGRFGLPEEKHGGFNQLAARVDPAPSRLLSSPPCTFSPEQIPALQEEIERVRAQLPSIPLPAVRMVGPDPMDRILPCPFPNVPVLCGPQSGLYLRDEGFRVVRRNLDYSRQMAEWVRRVAGGADPNDPAYPEPPEHFTRDFPDGVTLQEVGNFAPDIAQTLRWLFGAVDPSRVTLTRVAADPLTTYNEVVEAWESAVALAARLPDARIVMDW